MTLKVLSSNSTANGYVLYNAEEALVIEAGVPVSWVKKEVGYDTKKVKAVLVSHEHVDHAAHLVEYLSAGMTVAASAGTIKEKDVKQWARAKAVERGKTYTFGGFTVLPFKVEHDAAEPLGFLISHKETGVILFATDTKSMPYHIAGVTTFLIECNYDDETIGERVESGEANPYQASRVVKSHLALSTCKEFLRWSDLTETERIVLIHLSNDNADADHFRREVRRAVASPHGHTPIFVTTAKADDEYDVTKKVANSTTSF